MDTMQRPDGPLDAWIHTGEYMVVLPGAENGNFVSSSPIIGHKRLDRPKSVPPSLGNRNVRRDSASTYYGSTSNRPKTATGTMRTECERVHQVEHEPTRKHNLESHLAVKKIKPPPWQKALDIQPVPCTSGHGYSISRSKSKVAMTIKTDNFFDPPPVEKEGRRQEAERDPLIAYLQQQIDDLTLYLEEERLNHRETKRKAVDSLKDKLDDMRNHYEDSISVMCGEWEERFEAIETQHRAEMDGMVDGSESTMSKLRTEIEFLQGAFESYKSQLHREMDERWKKREVELQEENDNSMDEKLKELRARVQTERVAEKSDQHQAHQKELQSLKQEHKKEINQLMRRFSNAARDLDTFKQTKEELQDTKQELESVRFDYNQMCQQMAEVTTQLADAKLELMTFEQTFQDRVQDIDDKYKDQLNSLMTQNTELRRLYVQKCGELFDEKVETDNVRVDRLQSAKETMKFLIETRNDALVNLAATEPQFDALPRPSKVRPTSAPHTKTEVNTAILSASETDVIVRQRLDRKARASSCKPKILARIQAERQAAESRQDTPAEGGEHLVSHK